MKFKHSYFYSFPFFLMIDGSDLKYMEIINYKDFHLQFHVPYKSYPYNENFQIQSVFYSLPNGSRIKLPNVPKAAYYPIYDKVHNNIGMSLQKEPNYNLVNCQRLRYNSNVEIPDKLMNFIPVDTIRFDSDKEITHMTPKIIMELFGHLRILSGQWWLQNVLLRSSGANISGTCSMNGRINNFEFHTSLMPIMEIDNGKPIDSTIWKKALKMVSEEKEINFAKKLYLDALYSNSQNNDREVVLNIANSIDITINQFFIKYLSFEGRDRNNFNRDEFVKKYRPHKKVSSTYIPGLISEFLETLISKNYKTEFPDNYEVIRLFWLDDRNTIAHGGTVKYDRVDSKRIFYNTKHLIQWINKLPIS